MISDGPARVGEIYLDNNATTQPLPEVVRLVAEIMSTGYGNPSSVHRAGERGRQLLRKARQQVADAVGGDTEHVVFTSGATEANNLVLQCLRGRAFDGFRLVTSAVEHSSVLETARQLRREGHDVVIVPVDSRGLVRLEEVASAIKPGRTLVSVQWANNETGVVQPIEEIARIVHETGSLLHTDAVQAVGKVSVDVSGLPIDFLTLSGHKVHGPVGVGALVGPGLARVASLVFGGSQERGVRPGTENVPAIAGLGLALELRTQRWATAVDSTRRLRDRFETALVERGLASAINGAAASRLPNTSNLRFAGVDGEALTLRLDQLGVRCSQSSACTNQKPEPSYVLRAMGLSEGEAYASIRFGFSEFNTDQEIDQALDLISEVHSLLTRFALA